MARFVCSAGAPRLLPTTRASCRQEAFTTRGRVGEGVQGWILGGAGRGEGADLREAGGLVQLEGR